ncbi:metalloprotease family protein [Staphylococcus kloosii]|uniref:metalloprotease family protein n=1 Tax=Staphylococcus kloosii TaxID=29384 RepID=UPI0028A4C1AD|nr:metalloprotease family protein [Staphylococcus kloosii]MDT3958574.1 metalloprotease family protein [Staphylococcus kloosii]
MKSFVDQAFWPENKVHFGVAKGMIYCTIAPFMIITTIFIITLYIGVFPKVFFVTMATIHGMSCVGDFYWVFKIEQIPKLSKIEMTNTGIIITEKV